MHRMRFLPIIPLLALMLAGTACGPVITATPTANAISNPASLYCEANAGRLDLRTAADGSVSGVCVFPDGTECDEWAFFRGECQPAPSATDASAPSASVPTIQPILLQVLLPEDGSISELQECQVIGTTSPSAIVTVNDQILISNTDGSFQATVELEPGVNLIEVVASNPAGSEAFVNLTVTYQP
jgi:putative hemolysin